MFDDARVGAAVGRTTKPPSFGSAIGRRAGAASGGGWGIPRFLARSCELTTVSRPDTGTHDGRRSSDGVRTFGKLSWCSGGGRIVFDVSGALDVSSVFSFVSAAGGGVG